MAVQKLTSSADYPCPMDDLFDPETNEPVVSIYTLEQSELPLGIWMADDGVYEIVVENDLITKEILKLQLTELSLITGVEYEVVG